MTMRFAGAALAAVMACAGLGASAERAEAYSLTLTGIVVSNAENGIGSGTSLGSTVTLTVTGIAGPAYLPPTPSPATSPFVDLYVDGPSSFMNEAAFTGYTFNDGKTSARHSFGNQQVGPYGYAGFNIDFSSTSGNIPLDPEQSYSDTAISGGASFYYNLPDQLDDGSSVDQGYSFAVKLLTASNIGSEPIVSPVPLPASAPLFGAALLSLGALGYGMKRRGLPQAI